MKLDYVLPTVDGALISQLKTLSTAGRLELIRAVLETSTPDEAPTTEAEKALLDARLKGLELHPSDESPWSEVRARLERLLP